MRRYTFEPNENIAVAQAYDVNASYKDLCIVCNAIRYAKTADALAILEGVIKKERPIPFNKFNKHMGARHELHGRKGGYPVEAAKQVKKVLVNAMANADAKGIDSENALVVYATANKTRIERRYPSKGSLSWGRGMYGYAARVHSDLEYAKIEIGLASQEAAGRQPKKVVFKQSKAQKEDKEKKVKA
ncbi:MAG: 50S ribosomal protein L22 [Candidatus Micrarchaeia archaeon]